MLQELKDELLKDAATIRDLRRDMLFDRDTYMEDVPNSKVVQHITQALSFLELAKISLNLAITEIPEGNENGSDDSDESQPTPLVLGCTTGGD